MAPNPPSLKTTTTSKPSHTKLPRLQPNQKIQKRPLLHPPIAAPRAGASTQKIIYVSSSSPFVSTIKRVRGYLSEIESRAAGSISLSRHPNHKDKNGLRKVLEEGIERARSGEGKGKKGEEVVLKATGKAIERLLGVAMFFQKEEGVSVEVRTGSVGAVDDVVEEDGGEVESRIRRASVLEVGVRLV